MRKKLIIPYILFFGGKLLEEIFDRVDFFVGRGIAWCLSMIGFILLINLLQEQKK